MQTMTSNRRAFLAGTAAVLTGVAGGVPAASAAPAHRIRGIYPIAQTPCTADDKLNLKLLASQVNFCTRARVPGVVWPQLASGWITLSESERLSGAEAMLAAAKGSPTDVVIGVQARDGDRAVSTRLAKHAAAHGANALIALVSLPAGASDAQIMDYYKAIGDATPLPLVVQSTGQMSVDLVAQICNKVPTIACIKDEAGEPLDRIAALRQKTGGRVSIFAGRAAHTFLNELHENFDGNCPAFTLCDILQRTFELWHAGKQRQAFGMYSHYAAFMTIPHVDPYGMIARGFFPEGTRIRQMPGNKFPMSRLSQDNKRFIRKVYADFVKPYVTV